MSELPIRPDRPGVGAYATITKGGEFLTHPVGDGRRVRVNEGDRCLVLMKGSPRYREGKKIWVWVQLMDERGQGGPRIEVPWWWLTPRSILDDIADA